MRLISLEITNFRVIKYARLVFPDKVIGIIGPNGAGKSSIVEAISWALYGNQAARGAKDEIKAAAARPDANCEISLEFSVNEQQYKVIRRLVGRTGRAEVELYRGQASESVGVAGTKDYVGQLLGLDWRGFLSSFLARQQELNALSDLQPSRRRDHIAGMLGMERLDRAIMRVKDDTRLSEGKARFLESQLAEKGQVEDRVGELTRKLAEIQDPLDRLERSVKESQLQLETVSDKYQRLQQRRADWLELKVRIEAEEMGLVNLTDQQGSLRQEKEHLHRAEREMDALRRPLNELQVVRGKLDELNELKSQAALRDERATQKSRLLEELDKLDRQITDVSKAERGLSRDLQALPADIEDLLMSERRNLEMARTEYSRIRAEKGALEKEIGKLEEQLASIAELGPDSVCDRCHRPLGNDLEQIEAHLSEELHQLRRSAGEMSDQLVSQKEAGETLKSRVSELEQKTRMADQLRVRIESHRKQQTDLQSQREGRREELREVQRQLDRYRHVQFDPRQFADLKSRLEELERLQQKYDQLQGSLGRLPEVEKALERCSRKVSEAITRVDRLKADLSGSSYDEDEFARVSATFTESQNRLNDVKNSFVALDKEKELTRKELDGKLERMRSFERTACELEENRTAHYYGEKLGTLFAQFRKDLIASIRPSLAEISGRLYSEMTDGRYSLVDLDEKYNLRVMDGGEYYGVDRFSGGEKDLANLCLRLAISLALTESAGLKRSFVILDEVFGSQDTQRKELILKALARLKNRFPQILLVTHIEDIKDSVEELILVEPTGAGWSEVRTCNGNA